MVALTSLLLIVFLSILVTRVATVALTHTGLSTQSASFQARSALTGAGFTTRESERVVNHPVRRRIILLLMLAGNAGIVTAVSSLILAFVDQSGRSSLGARITLLVAGLVVLWTIAASRHVDRHISRLVDWTLCHYTDLDVRDYASLMHLVGDYRLVELRVEPRAWLAGKALEETALRDEGVVVLGVQRPKGVYLGAPKGSTELQSGDLVILYGRAATLEALDERTRDQHGDREHEQAVAEHRDVVREQELKDPAQAF